MARAEPFKIALDLRVHPGAVDDRVPGAAGLHFVDREGVADDVLGEPPYVLAVAGRHALAAVDVEPRVLLSLVAKMMVWREARWSAGVM